MKYSLENINKGLPRWSKGVIVLGSTLIVGFIAYKLIKLIGKGKQQTILNGEEEGKSAQNELDKLADKGVKTKFSKTQLETFSSTIVRSLEGCTEDEDAVINIFKQLETRVDVLALIYVFGQREVLPCAPSSPFSWLLSQTGLKKFGGNLTSILRWGLNESEMNEINNILKSKKIDYVF